MKGGFYNPPNDRRVRVRVQPGDASMKGGFNNPPNPVEISHRRPRPLASMKGGFNNPPNEVLRLPLPVGIAGFNEGGVQ